MSARIHPEMVDLIRKSGRNEIAVHGWIHEMNSQLPYATEKRLLERAVDYWTKTLGQKPTGYRAPSWNFSGELPLQSLTAGDGILVVPAGTTLTAYLLATTAVVPLAGKLSDQFGRKGFLLSGIALFLLGSGLAGAARSRYFLRTHHCRRSEVGMCW